MNTFTEQDVRSAANNFYAINDFVYLLYSSGSNKYDSFPGSGTVDRSFSPVRAIVQGIGISCGLLYNKCDAIFYILRVKASDVYTQTDAAGIFTGEARIDKFKIMYKGNCNGAVAYLQKKFPTKTGIAFEKIYTPNTFIGPVGYNGRLACGSGSIVISLSARSIAVGDYSTIYMHGYGYGTLDIVTARKCIINCNHVYGIRTLTALYPVRIIYHAYKTPVIVDYNKGMYAPEDLIDSLKKHDAEFK